MTLFVYWQASEVFFKMEVALAVLGAFLIILAAWFWTSCN